MSFFKNALCQATGNRPAQLALDGIVRKAQMLMGIGSGTGVESSGEQAVFKVMLARAKGPYCVLDVGANQGQFLRLARRCIGDRPHAIHCFEPGAATFQLLTAAAGADARVRLNNVGVSRASGTAELHYDAPGSGLASLTQRDLAHFGIDFGRKETVTLTTLDAYCAAQAIGRVNLLKIDIEGHELDALAGAERLFAARQVDMVMFEFGGCNIDTRTYFRDFWHFFAKQNMDIHRLTPSGHLFKITKYKEILEQFRTSNFVALARN